jgi:hypothetical protein
MDDTITETNATLNAEQIVTRSISRWLVYYIGQGGDVTDLIWLHQLLEEVAHATSNKDRALAFHLNLEKRYSN